MLAKQNKQRNIIITLLLLALVSLAFYGLYANNARQLKAWAGYSQQEVSKALTLRTIVANVGYGGFIHNFKNGVLRLDPNLLHTAQTQLQLAQQAIEEYRGVAPGSDQELDALADTLREYAAKLELGIALVAAGTGAQDIDKRVKVSDERALAALNTLLTANKNTTLRILEHSALSHTEFKRRLLITYMAIIAIIVVALSYVTVIGNRIISQLKEKKAVFDLAPNAILTIETGGLITAANAEALKLFKLNRSDLGSLYFDQLVAPQSKAEIGAMRTAARQIEGANTVITKGKNFVGETRTGYTFPASISVASYHDNNKQLNIAVIEDLSETRFYAKQANTDALTKLPNRRALDSALDTAIAQANRTNAPFALAIIDIDHFKTINDQHGHLAGDNTLMSLATTVQALVRSSDFWGRWGGEEFMLLLPAVNGANAYRICEKLRTEIEAIFLTKPQPITVSIGISEFRNSDTARSLIHRADAALYQAKSTGRNKCVRDDEAH